MGDNNNEGGNNQNDNYPSSDEGNILKNPSEDNILDSLFNNFKYYDISCNEIDSLNNLSILNSYSSIILLGLLIILICSFRIILYMFNDYILEYYKIKERYPKLYQFILSYRMLSKISIWISAICLILSFILILIVTIYII